jgi:hypothetical protein
VSRIDLAASGLILEGAGVVGIGVGLGVALGVGLSVAMGLGTDVIGVAVGPEVLLQPAIVKTNNTANKPIRYLFMIALPIT